MPANKRMCLKVVVQSGRFDGGDGGGDIQDPICRVTLGKQVHDTPPGEGSKPRWKANFIFCYGKDDTLRFEALDNDIVLGCVEVDLDSLTSRPDQSYRGKLELTPSGTLRVELKMLPFKRGLDGAPAEAAQDGRPPMPTASTTTTAAPPEVRTGSRGSLLRTTASQEKPSIRPRTMPKFHNDDPSKSGSKGLLLLMPELGGANGAIASLWGDLASDAAPPPKPEREFFVLKDDDILEFGEGVDDTSTTATGRVGSATRAASGARGQQRSGSTSSHRCGDSLEHGLLVERRNKRQTVHIPSPTAADTRSQLGRTGRRSAAEICN
eukprot:Lankesteria_metandrocarpae@DN2775_c0_g1_i1.p1